ncbi:MAG: putative universal stress protein [Firmicutes bacterium]|nr:putative universal stress protein [Bacillota bacterium]
MIVASGLTKGESEIVRCLKNFRNLGTEKILLLRCLNLYEMEAKTSSLVTDVFEENFLKQKEILSEMGYEVDTRIAAGVVRNEINKISEGEGYSIVAAGYAKHSKLGEALFGGVAHELINTVRKPLLLIRIPGNEEKLEEGGMEGCDPLSHILLPTDFSPNSFKAFEVAKKMAGSGAKRFTIVHVINEAHVNEGIPHRLVEFSSSEMNAEMRGVQSTSDEWLRKLTEEDSARLQEMKSELMGKGGVQVDVRLLFGKPAGELKRFIEENGISLTVMGSQGSGFIKELYLGSVSREIVRRSDSSVLLVPAERIP